jgi:3-dehydroquinate dehydratase-2
MNLLIINGPNLNLLGQREPKIYGKKTLQDILDDVFLYSKNHNINIETFQSNHEGEIVDMIQKSNDL